MNHSRTNSQMVRVLSILFFLFCASVPLEAAVSNAPRTSARPHTANAAVPRKPQSFQQRKESAAHQLLQYQHIAAAAKVKTGRTTSSGVPTKSVTISVQKNIQSASTIFFHDDMESGLNGWTTTTIGDTTAQWHQTSATWSSPSHSWWQGVETTRTYATGHKVKGSLVSPPVNLSGATGDITLLFSENYFTEHYWDFCMVDVTTDAGAHWTNLRGSWGFAPSGSSGGWTVTGLSLTPYANQTVQVRFAFDTGDSLYNDFPGWYVDDVVIFDQSGRIAGDTYYDKNRNGMWDIEEPDLDGWSITAAGPITVTTFTSGGYSLSLPTGSYQVSEEVPYPWLQVFPPGARTVELTTDNNYADTINFGNYRPACLVTGTVFNDLDKDSLRGIADTSIVGRYIELDNQVGDWIDETVTDSSGNFNFLVYDPGGYYIREYLPYGWVSTIPGGSDPSYSFNVTGSGDTTISGFLFGSYETPYVPPPNSVTISGYVFNDLNMNGVWDDREPGVENMTVVASGPDGVGVPSGSGGRFVIEGLQAGTYTVSLEMDYTWGQSLPQATYSITLLPGETRDSVLFGAYLLPTGTIRGVVYNDVNRSGIRDSGEAGLPGWTVSVGDPDIWQSTSVTDSAGEYRFDGIVMGSHAMQLYPLLHWGKSSSNPVGVTLAAQEIKDSVDFGAYALQPGSISGTVFIDVNANGIHDSNERPLRNCHFGLATGNSLIRSSVTDDSGRFRFDAVWGGTYVVSMALNSQWRQTYPPLLQPFIVSLSDEEHVGGLEFGATNDTTLNPAFRSFLPESIAFSYDLKGKIGKAIPSKYTACDAVFDLMVPDTGLTGLHVEFNNIVDGTTLSANRFDPILTKGITTKRFEFGMHGSDTLSDGDHIILFAHAKVGKELYISKYWWIKGAVSPYPPRTTRGKTHGTYQLLYPIPNVNNLLAELYVKGILGSSGIVVGDPGTPRIIYHPKWGDVLKTVIYHGLMATNGPTCIGHMLPGRPVTTRPYRTLPPARGGNVLFTEAIALKFNIALSDLATTPSGFGSLVFEADSTNPFNGLSVYELAALTDTAISSFDNNVGGCRYDSTFFTTLYRTIRMIDSAFCGPFGVVSWDGKTIVMKPIRYVSDVSFLKIDTSQSLAARARLWHHNELIRPAAFRLDQNYPNPFNPATRISFTLPATARVTLKIYNLLGQEVAVLLDKDKVDEGEQQVLFNASSLASGIYYYRLVADGTIGDDGTKGESFTAVRKMVLLK